VVGLFNVLSSLQLVNAFLFKKSILECRQAISFLPLTGQKPPPHAGLFKGGSQMFGTKRPNGGKQGSVGLF
jgi:hypothetical protein